ncbi:MAG: DUF1993 domain-containing protein, partial [Alphaproteobacteria bacterium]|nr:DUF1993 domain-containing protein [Alphaproteobacteria bacterium]
MSFTLYDASIPPMIRGLQNLSKILDKAVAQAKSEDRDLNTLLEGRLAPDMFPFTRQIQIVSDTAKGCAARLTGSEPPAFPDDEKTFPELRQRIVKTIDYLKSFRAEQFEGADTRKVTLKFPNGSMSFSGSEYVTGFVLPNFYFHVTAAYAILRHNGIGVGKMDYLG